MNTEKIQIDFLKKIFKGEIVRIGRCDNQVAIYDEHSIYFIDDNKFHLRVPDERDNPDFNYKFVRKFKDDCTDALMPAEVVTYKNTEEVETKNVFIEGKKFEICQFKSIELPSAHKWVNFKLVKDIFKIIDSDKFAWHVCSNKPCVVLTENGNIVAIIMGMRIVEEAL